MAEIYTFNVVPDDIGRLLPRIAFDALSAPTETQAEDIILDHAAELSAFLTGMGVGIQAINDHPEWAMYRVCQRYILLRFAAQVIRLRNQNSQTMADRLDEQADGLKETLRTRPADMGAQRPNGANSPNILRSNANYPEQIYTRSINSRSRVAINAAVDRM
jgi:hypothetical protein